MLAIWNLENRSIMHVVETDVVQAEEVRYVSLSISSVSTSTPLWDYLAGLFAEFCVFCTPTSLDQGSRKALFVPVGSIGCQ